MGAEEKRLTYWQEKELDVAVKILAVAITLNDRVATFDPVKYSLDEANRFIRYFKQKHDCNGLD